MKEIAKNIYGNSFLLYGIGILYSLFILLVSFKDLSDLITREAVVGYSLLTFLLSAGLFINEAGKSFKTESNEEYQEDNSNQILQTTQFSQSQNEIEEENERVIYEWDEEEFEEEIPPVLKNETPAKKELV